MIRATMRHPAKQLLFLMFFLWICCAFALTQEPEKVTACQLEADPPKYNHKVVEVTAFVSHGFEDFTLVDPTCGQWLRVWLEYGGTAASGTIYCCGPTNTRTRPKPLKVEGIPISLLEDELFKKFDGLVHDRPDSIVHATMVGTFFSGRLMKYPKATFFGGYGHMGCCSLLTIQKVLALDPHDRTDVDYGTAPQSPDTERVGCGYRDMLDLMPYAEALRRQQLAEEGKEEEAFRNSKDVAVNTLATALNIDANSIDLAQQATKLQGRAIYEWKPEGNAHRYMVVVSRPYWLSFYAKNPVNVAWVPIAAYDAWCGDGNGKTVTRIK
jgi:hypothetical protein